MYLANSSFCRDPRWTCFCTNFISNQR